MVWEGVWSIWDGRESIKEGSTVYNGVAKREWVDLGSEAQVTIYALTFRID
jgi:hypothetical protein